APNHTSIDTIHTRRAPFASALHPATCHYSAIWHELAISPLGDPALLAAMQRRRTSRRSGGWRCPRVLARRCCSLISALRHVRTMTSAGRGHDRVKAKLLALCKVLHHAPAPWACSLRRCCYSPSSWPSSRSDGVLGAELAG